jgi:hypothetical protein
MVVTIFCMCYKGPKEGSVNLFGSYRPTLYWLNLARVQGCGRGVSRRAGDRYIAQDGFRAHTGSRGNNLRVILFMTVTGTLGMQGLLSMLDYSGAFDALSHRFIDEVLGTAGARNKLRALHRRIRELTTGKVRVRGPVGTMTLRGPFKMLKGGAQGRLSVPWVFCAV